MKIGRAVIYSVLAICLSVELASAQLAPCLDAADESHHQVLYQDSDVRILQLDLPRIASTQPFCYAHPFLYIVTREGRSSSTLDGRATLSYDWNGPEARFVYKPAKQVIRNESMIAFREIIVETLRPVQYDPLAGNGDLFPPDLGTMKPTWTVSFAIGTLAGSKTQLAQQDKLAFRSGRYLLIALSDLRLRRSKGQNDPEDLQVAAQEVQLLQADSDFTLTNSGSESTKFIMVEF